MKGAKIPAAFDYAPLVERLLDDFDMLANDAHTETLFGRQAKSLGQLYREFRRAEASLKRLRDAKDARTFAYAMRSCSRSGLLPAFEYVNALAAADEETLRRFMDSTLIKARRVRSAKQAARRASVVEKIGNRRDGVSVHAAVKAQVRAEVKRLGNLPPKMRQRRLAGATIEEWARKREATIRQRFYRAGGRSAKK